ncbi:MAG: CRISPR-associated protein Csx19 [Nitrospirota bacterium]|nr:CRISPR-associated protein Csx19 [Nitrospirota bacterium]
MPLIGNKKGCNESEVSKLASDIDYKFAILEKPDDIRFIKKSEINSIGNLFDWDRGRLFGENVELRWLKRRNGFHVVIISENGGVAEKLNPEEINPVREREIYLWGENIEKSGNTTDDWYEQRIPRILNYPVNATKIRGRLKLIVKEYSLSSDKGTVHRYVGLKEE